MPWLTYCVGIWTIALTMWCSVCYDLSVYTVIKAGIRIYAKCVLRVRTRSLRVTRSVFATRSIAFKILSIPVTKSCVTAQGNVCTLYFLSIVVTPRRILTNTNEINLAFHILNIVIANRWIVSALAAETRAINVLRIIVSRCSIYTGIS